MPLYIVRTQEKGHFDTYICTYIHTVVKKEELYKYIAQCPCKDVYVYNIHNSSDYKLVDSMTSSELYDI